MKMTFAPSETPGRLRIIITNDMDEVISITEGSASVTFEEVSSDPEDPETWQLVLESWDVVFGAENRMKQEIENRENDEFDNGVCI